MINFLVISRLRAYKFVKNQYAVVKIDLLTLTCNDIIFLLKMDLGFVTSDLAQFRHSTESSIKLFNSDGFRIL